MAENPFGDPPEVLRGASGSNDIADLLGFHPPMYVPLPEDITAPFIDAIKGKRFGSDVVKLLSR